MRFDLATTGLEKLDLLLQCMMQNVDFVRHSEHYMSCEWVVATSDDGQFRGLVLFEFVYPATLQIVTLNVPKQYANEDVAGQLISWMQQAAGQELNYEKLSGQADVGDAAVLKLFTDHHFKASAPYDANGRQVVNLEWTSPVPFQRPPQILFLFVEREEDIAPALQQLFGHPPGEPEEKL